MSDVIIFGLQDFAELAHYYLAEDSPHNVIAFCVSKSFVPEGGKFNGLPVLAFEDVQQTHPPTDVCFFAPMSPKKMNRDRARVFNEIRSKGYKMISYISSKATIFNNNIGENCFILENNTLQPFTSVGDNVVLWSGNHLGHHSKINDHVTFTSHVVMSGHCDIGAYSFLGVNSTLRDWITIGEGSFIAMATSVVKNTEPWSFYKGNPAVKMDMPSTKIKL